MYRKKLNQFIYINLGNPKIAGLRCSHCSLHFLISEMSYKIVETVERGKKVLSVVPENWERLGNLKWPRKNYEKLKLDPNSKPDKTWLSMPCNVKRTNLSSYDKAEKEISRMSDVTDTELEEEEMCVPTVTSKKRNFDFNYLTTTSIMVSIGFSTESSSRFFILLLVNSVPGGRTLR